MPDEPNDEPKPVLVQRRTEQKRVTVPHRRMDQPADGQAAVVGPWHGVYLPHGWIASPRTPNEIASRVALVAGAGFTHQLHNVGFLDSTGSVPSAVADGLVAWTEASRAAAPGEGVIAWISGSEATHVDSPQTWATIADSLAALVERAGLDGVLLDLEPFSPDNESLVGLLELLRDRLPATWLGLTAPIPQDRWSAEFIRRVSALVDAVSPMAYDSAMTHPDDYSRWASDGLERYRLNLSPTAALLPSLPAYSANRWHDPAVENLRNVSGALSGVGGVDGAAVYWWWEMGEEDLAAWALLTT